MSLEIDWTGTGEPAEPSRSFAFVPASAVRSERVEWLSEPWIPRRSLTLLAGREGLGKSTIAVDIAARATRGELDNRRPLRVLYLATEDSRSMTVKPRLEAAGADLDAVGFLDVTLDGYGGALSLPGDYSDLEDLIAAEGIGLVILDAAKSAMSSALNDHRDDDVRRFLEPMSRIADSLDCVFLALVHFGKRVGTDSGSLILGSIAWSQVARSVLSVARDDESGTLVVTNTKGNLAPRELSRECAIISAEVPVTAGGTTSTGRVEWHGESDRSARDLLGAREDQDDDERGEIESVVIDYLEAAGGSAPAGEVLKAARAAGLSDNAVKKARRKIGVRTERRGFGPGAQWVWAIDSPIDSIDSRAHEREPMTSMAPMSAPGEGANVPEDSEGARVRERESSPPSGESSAGAAPDTAREAVLSMLVPDYPLAARTIAGGVVAEYRETVPEVLEALESEGVVARLGDRYTLAAGGHA